MNKAEMSFYSRLDASFWCKNVEYPLYAINIDEYDDSIEVVSPARHPEIERGCVGNLILIGVDGRNIDFDKDGAELKDCYQNVLLGKIQVYSAKSEECPYWKYIFLKD